MKNKSVRNIAIMGLGTVGGGAYDIIASNGDYIERTQGLDVRVKRILDRTDAPLRARGIDPSLYCGSVDELAADKEIEVVVETMGGVEPAKTFITKMLESGKSVVTANKELLAKFWHELEPIAAAHGCGLFFEASCVGGVPVIRALGESFQGDRVQSICGIINGTTNYILSKMSRENLGYAEALGAAQSLGYAEADPTSDVEGYDAAYKLSILGSLAFHTCLPYGSIYREGITKVTAADIKNAHDLGYEIKLLAIGKRDGNNVEARVHPAFVPKNHPLASVSGAYNAVYLNGDHVGDLMFYGAGAGAHPTGSAIVSDVIKALSDKPRYCDFANTGKLDKSVSLVGDFVSGYYLCVTVDDKAGVLSRLSTVLSDNGVSIKAATQSPSDGDAATVMFLTHRAREHAVMQSLEAIGKLASVRSVDSVIRVL
ncbi:MAG: homoserine dehydrogenase [Clostridia bacterium]|jgi:homoserine dehydrogenase|nr:homoserine dehydrogenase [Clostridia bacterium]MCI9459319.1 homoserine dehydrogenase [Clostridia bacterium]